MLSGGVGERTKRPVQLVEITEKELVVIRSRSLGRMGGNVGHEVAGCLAPRLGHSIRWLCSTPNQRRSQHAPSEAACFRDRPPENCELWKRGNYVVDSGAIRR